MAGALKHLRPMRGQLDRLDARATLIEKRLDLVESETSIKTPTVERKN
jgi:hypothetical protein